MSVNSVYHCECVELLDGHLCVPEEDHVGFVSKGDLDQTEESESS